MSRSRISSKNYFMPEGGSTSLLSDSMGWAEDLASIGLRSCQIQRLTGMSPISVARLVAAVKAPRKTGRRKTSQTEAFSSPLSQTFAAFFAAELQHQMSVSGANDPGAADVVRAFTVAKLKLPVVAAQADWERVIEMALAVLDGQAKLGTCSVCSSVYIASSDEMHSGSSCVTCRIGESLMSVRASARSRSPELAPVEGGGSSFPRKAGHYAKRRAVMHLLVSSGHQ